MIAALLMAYLLAFAPDARDVANAQDVQRERALLTAMAERDSSTPHERDWARFYLSHIEWAYDAEGYPR